MKKYRLCYDKTFICPDNFNYKGESITCLAVFFEYSLIDKVSGKETFFICNDEEDMSEQTVNGYYLNDFYKCYYNSKLGYEMIPNEKILAFCQNDVVYKVDRCYKWKSGLDCPIEINHNEFCDILVNSSEYLDITDNKPTQNCAYCCKKYNY